MVAAFFCAKVQNFFRKYAVVIRFLATFADTEFDL